MKISSKTQLAIILLIILTFCVIYLGVHTSPTGRNSLTPQPLRQKIMAENIPAQIPTALPVSASPNPASQLVLPSGWQAMSVEDMIASPEGQQRLQQFQQVYDNENAKPINVYGKVVDQHGNPVVGAEVVGGTMLYVSAERSSGEDFPPVITDAKGLFSFVGFHGARFGVKISKTGYDYNTSLFVGWWDNYTPDPSNPAIFTMWKLAGAEPMVHIKLDGRVPYDGQTAKFDILTGKKSPTGDFCVTFERTPRQVQRGVDHFAWNVKIEVVAGGLVQATDIYKNLAPESGYQSAFTYAQAKDDPKWMRNLTEIFYVRTAKGQFGRVSIDLAADSARPDTGISIEAWMNPSGSRNLEFDPAKELKSK